ncbi:Uncharacterised protein [Enterobacter cloacae]|nr:Uncharacterised protein [Enterobacter cloacae]
MLIEQVIFQIDDFIVKFFYKLAGMFGQRITHIHQPAAAIRWSRALFQIVNDVIQRQHFSLAGGNNQPFIHINTHGHQLIRTLIRTAVYTTQRN